MSVHKFHVVAVSSWFALVLVSFGASLASGVPVTLAGSLFWLALACLPPLMLLTVFRGAPPQTIAEVLYDQEHGATDTGRRIRRER